MKKFRKLFLLCIAALCITASVVPGTAQQPFSVTAEAATKLSTPKISSVSNTTSGVKVKWGKVSNAKGYYIYRSTSKSGTYTKIATIKSGSTVTYTNKSSGSNKVSSGKTYYCKIVAYSGSTTSSRSSAKGIRYLTAGKFSSISNTTSGAKLTWSKVSGASGYYIYRKTSSGSYSKIKTISSASTVTYTDTKVKNKSGTTYTYKVVPYYGSTTGSYTGKSIYRLSSGTISSLANTSSGITVKWSKISGASGYYVYRKTSSGSYSKIKTISSASTVSYTDTAVKNNNGTTYTYAVKPYYGSTTGSYTGKTTVRLTAPTISSISSPDCNSLTLAWRTASSVDGYQMQYSVNDSSFSDPTTKTYSGTSTSSKTITGLYSANTYYTRIRTYKTVDGTKYYSAWSSVKNVEISYDHDYIGVIIQQPTCTEIGWWEYTCSVCGATYGKSIPMVDHSYVSEIIKEATCAEDGKMSYTCSVCGDTYTKTIAATGDHDYQMTASRDATCTEDGYRTYTCSVCGDSYTETVEATGHSYTSEVTNEATCVDDGVMTYTCTECGSSYTEVIAATGKHDYQLTDSKDAACTEDGYKIYTCSVCGDSYTETTDATGHTSTEEWEIETEATVDAYGTKVIRCADCGEVLESKNYAVENAGSTGINVNWHSQADIIAYLAENPIDTTSAVTYDTEPSIYGGLTIDSLGSVSKDSQETALTALNSIRYIAGIDDNVTLNSEYSQYAQGASLINAYYGTLNHHPEQPSVMDDETYEICYTGDSSSNISAGRNTLASMLLGQVSDSSSSNITTVGHRRWILNPAMGETGFGFVQTSSGYKYYSAMYAFDESNTDAEYYGVTWPAQNMPVEYFSSTDPWSLSIGDDIDSSVTEVTLTRISDGKTWTFSEDSADGDFYVNNGYYGYFSCIIFRPDDITYSDGDQFAVTITGLDEEVSYQVNFFSCD